MLEALAATKSKVIGFKQTLRALRLNQAARVFLAEDVEASIVQKVLDACQAGGVVVERVPLKQAELGKLCKIEVGASMVTLLRE